MENILQRELVKLTVVSKGQKLTFDNTMLSFENPKMKSF